MNKRPGNIRDDAAPTAVLSRRSALAILPIAGVANLSTSTAATVAQDRVEYPAAQSFGSFVVPSAVQRIVTQGFAEPGDGGGAVWRRTNRPPAHPGVMTDASGAVFEIDEGVLLPEMFGAKGGDGDDLAAIQQAVTIAIATKRRVEFRRARYSLAGEIVIPAEAERFALIGSSMTELVQLRDDTSIFFFRGENTHHWVISGFRFMWRRDQSSRNRNAYAVRFETDRSGGAGHWNFEIDHCILSNGFRGFGQSEDGQSKPKCPVWGATFRRIHVGLKHRGAAIFLRTWGKTGQPNNRIEEFYARCDGMSEPAIVIENSDTAFLSSVEFNQGSGCRILVESSSNVIIDGMRFEHVALRPKEAFVVASGEQTNMRLSGLSVQSIILAPTGSGSAPLDAAVVRVLNGARVNLLGFTDMPWRAPSALRDSGTRNTVAVVETQGGQVTAGFLAPLFDPALTLARQGPGGHVRFSDADTYDFVFEGMGSPTFARQLVRQRSAVVAASIRVDGIDEDTLRRLTLHCDGVLVLKGEELPLWSAPTGANFVLANALKTDEARLVLTGGSVLVLRLPTATMTTYGCSLLLSIITVGM